VSLSRRRHFIKSEYYNEGINPSIELFVYTLGTYLHYDIIKFALEL
jgi:hypothetical protein